MLRQRILNDWLLGFRIGGRAVWPDKAELPANDQQRMADQPDGVLLRRIYE
jgi:hypothetical protein